MICALASSVCFGAASVLQAMAARAATPGTGGGVDVALMLRALRQWRYVAGLGMDGLGFVLQIVALRTLPIYVVGAALAASLAVTAVIASRVLRVRLSRVEWTAVGVVCAGLALLALASGKEGHEDGPSWLPWALLASSFGVLLLGVVGGRLPEKPRALVLGLGAGFGFGVVEVAVRLIDGIDFADPVWYALLVGGGAAFLLLTSAPASRRCTASQRMASIRSLSAAASVTVSVTVMMASSFSNSDILKLPPPGRTPGLAFESRC